MSFPERLGGRKRETDRLTYREGGRGRGRKRQGERCTEGGRVDGMSWRESEREGERERE